MQQIQKKSLDDFSLIICLGKGTYAKVVLVREKTTRQIYAMKILKKKHIKVNNQEEHIQTERNVLANVKHPFIIKLIYSFQTHDKLYFVMEYTPGGELFNLLQKCQRINEDYTRFYVSQVVLAIEALHQRDIIYRDLKPENILIDSKGYIRIADFGLSKSGVRGKQDANSICGTPEYLAPEILDGKGHGKPVDYWALGALIYEMLTGIPPFYSEVSREDLFDKIKNQQVQIPSFLTPKCQDLLYRLLQKDADLRLGSVDCGGMQDIKNHPWFANINWDILCQKQYQSPFVPIVQNEEDTQNFSEEFTKISPFSLQQNTITDYKMYPNFTYTGSVINNGMDIEQ